jgi:hypothetical protein
VQIDVEVKKYFCKAGVKGMQVGQMLGALIIVFALTSMGNVDVGGWKNQGWGSLGGQRAFSGEKLWSSLLALATRHLAGDS